MSSADPKRFILTERHGKIEIEKLDYMHMNPVKRGLALRSVDWIWSSTNFYARRESKTIRIDPFA